MYPTCPRFLATQVCLFLLHDYYFFLFCGRCLPIIRFFFCPAVSLFYTNIITVFLFLWQVSSFYTIIIFSPCIRCLPFIRLLFFFLQQVSTFYTIYFLFGSRSFLHDYYYCFFVSVVGLVLLYDYYFFKGFFVLQQVSSFYTIIIIFLFCGRTLPTFIRLLLYIYFLFCGTCFFYNIIMIFVCSAEGLFLSYDYYYSCFYFFCSVVGLILLYDYNIFLCLLFLILELQLSMQSSFSV